MQAKDFLLVMTTCPDEESAEALALALVERRLAACVSRLAPCVSTYRWDEEIEQEEEIPLLIKTRAECYPELEAAVIELHPYEVPELLALPLATGLPAYFAWVTDETTPE